MYQEFLIELSKALRDSNVLNPQLVVDEYREKYAMLFAAGKSEFECIIALGDPLEIARKLAGNDYSITEKLANNLIDEADLVDVAPLRQPKSGKPPTKAGIICTDIFYIVPITIVCTLGIIALAFISGLIGFSGASYCILAFIKFTVLKEQLLCFAMALGGVIMFIGGAIATLSLIKTMVSGLKLHFHDRSAKLAALNDI